MDEADLRYATDSRQWKSQCPTLVRSGVPQTLQDSKAQQRGNMPDAGCDSLPMFGANDDMGCQTDALHDDESSEDESGSENEEEEWWLEQMNMAHQYVARQHLTGRGEVSQLKEYEQRSALDEVRAAYERLAKELGETPLCIEDAAQEGASAKTTQEMLAAYRAPFHDILQRRAARESAVSLLCRDVYALMEQAPTGLENPVFAEVETAATFQSKLHKRNRRSFGMISLLPKGGRYVNVHAKSVTTLEGLKQGLEQVLAKKKKKEEEKAKKAVEPPPAAPSADTDVAAPSEAWVAADKHDAALPVIVGAVLKCGGECAPPRDAVQSVEKADVGAGLNCGGECSPPREALQPIVKGVQPCLARGTGTATGKPEARPLVKKSHKPSPKMKPKEPTAALTVPKAVAEEFTGPVQPEKKEKFSMELYASLDESQLAASTMPLDAWHGVVEKGTPVGVWREHFTPLLETLYISEASEYAVRLEQLVMNIEEDEMVAAQAFYAKERLVKAAELHEPLTETLKKVSADHAMMDCYEELSSQGRGRYPLATARGTTPEKQARVDECRRELSESVNAAFEHMDSFRDATGGVAYCPPHILSVMVGIPPTDPEIVEWLRSLQTKYRLHKPPVAMGDFSACI